MIPTLLAGFPLGSSLGLVAAFEWLGMPYHLSRIRMPDDLTTGSFAKLNKRQETPVLVSDEGPLTETMAIVL